MLQLNLFAQVLSGILPGAGPAMSVGAEWAAAGGSPRRGTGHLFMALDVAAFADYERFTSDMDV